MKTKRYSSFALFSILSAGLVWGQTYVPPIIRTGKILPEKFQSQRPPLRGVPFTEMIDPATGQKVSPSTITKLPNGKSITVGEFWQKMSSLEVKANSRGFTLHGFGKKESLAATFTANNLQRQLAKDGRAPLSKNSMSLYQHGAVANGMMFPAKGFETIRHLPISRVPVPMFKLTRGPGAVANTHFAAKRQNPLTMYQGHSSPPPQGIYISVPTKLLYGATTAAPDNQPTPIVYSTSISTTNPKLLFSLPSAPYGKYMWQMIDRDASPAGFGPGDPNFADMTSNLVGWGNWKTPSIDARNLVSIDLAKWMEIQGETQAVPHHFLVRAVPVGINGAALDTPSNEVSVDLVPGPKLTISTCVPSLRAIDPANNPAPLDKTWGDPDIMAAFIKGGVTASGTSQERTEDFNLKAGVYVLSCELDLLDAEAHAHVSLPASTSPGGPQAEGDATLSVKILGNEMITDGVGNANGYSQSIALGAENLVDYPISVSFQQGIPVGPVDVSITATFSGDFGIGATLDVDTGSGVAYGVTQAATYPITFALTPHASISASATGAVGIGVDGFDLISAGINVDVNILTLDSALQVGCNGDYAFVLRNATVCSGQISAEATLGSCPFCVSYSVGICSWPGSDLTGGAPVTLLQGLL